MNAEKLTLEMCFKYPNARIKYNSAKTESCESIDSFLTYSHLHKRDISDCKLILRPLSSLTDEEKKEIPQYIKETYYKSIYYDDDVAKLSNYSLFIADYFRSINIDIDGLQERGVAIYE